jgi:hypothetical protein
LRSLISKLCFVLSSVHFLNNIKTVRKKKVNSISGVVAVGELLGENLI